MSHHATVVRPSATTAAHATRAILLDEVDVLPVCTSTLSLRASFRASVATPHDRMNQCGKLPLRPLHALGLALALASVAPWVVAAQPVSGRSGFDGAGSLVMLRPPRMIATAAASVGYGYTGSVLGERDRHHRLTGGLALAFHPVDALSLAVSMTGRRDAHRGDAGSELSMVGDPRFHVLVRLLHVGVVRLGLGAELWAPSGDSVAIVAAALSPSASLYIQLEWDGFTLAARIGYLHDRSVRTIPAGRMYSGNDQVSLGVTAADAVLVGLGAVGHVGPVDIYGEFSIDALVRRSAGLPFAASRTHATVGAMTTIAERYRLGLQVELSPGSYPEIRTNVPYRVSPRFAVALTYAAHLGTLSSAEPEVMPEPAVVRERASVRGVALDEAGVPVAGALVRVEAPEVQTGDEGSNSGARVVGEARSDDAGEFVVEDVPPGTYELVVNVPGRSEVRSTVTLDGDLALPPLRVGERSRSLRGRVDTSSDAPLRATVRVLSGAEVVAEVTTDDQGAYVLDDLPSGPLTLVIEAEGREPWQQELGADARGEVAGVTLTLPAPEAEIRGTVHRLRGAALGARVTLEPTGATLVADVEGRFAMFVEPGSYVVHIEADGHRPQDRRVMVEESGVVVLEVHLRPQ